jgi:hypothetical protein
MRGLERYEGAPVELIHGATRRALENLVALAIAEDVRFVVIAGDLYDSDWKDSRPFLNEAGKSASLRFSESLPYGNSGPLGSVGLRN